MSCKPRPGGADLGDAANGVDNSLGANLAPVMLSLDPAASQHLTQAFEPEAPRCYCACSAPAPVQTTFR